MTESSSDRLVTAVFHQLEAVLREGSDDPLVLFSSLLLTTGMSRRFSIEAGRWDQLEHYVRRSIEHRAMTPALIGGLSGFLFATRTASARCGVLKSLAADLSELVPALVHYSELPQRENNDLISGGAGIAVAILEQEALDRSHANVLATSLMATGSIKNDTVHWNIGELERKGTSGQDLGIAHGVPGILLALHRISQRASSDVQKASAHFIVNCLRWLRDQRNPAHNYSLFPYLSTAPAESRLAWCYGDLSVGFTLLALGHLYEDHQSIETGVTAINSAAERPVLNSMITDPFLCHGIAGVVCLLNEASRISGGRVPPGLLSRWEGLLNAEVEAFLDSGVRPDIGYLEGWGGVALYYIHKDFPEDSQWLRPLLLTGLEK